MKIWAVIPARPFAEGKSRLASAMSTAERARLNESFFRHTLETAAAVVGRDRAIVVSRSAELLTMAEGLGFRALTEMAPHGLNEALTQGSDWARAQGAEAVLSLSCDLPFVAAADLRALIAETEAGVAVAIAPDRAGTGTNAMILAPPGAVPYRYGESSLAAHLDAARAARVSTRIVERAGLGFDVDAPDDLEQMEELGRERAHAVLRPL